MNQWQPIETAPRDGTWVLIAGGRTTEDDYNSTGVLTTRPVTAFWSEPLWEEDAEWAFCFWDGDWREGYLNPTHWMPLPQPPEGDQ